MINLEEKTLNELKDLAKENNIKNISKLKKEELVEVLSSVLSINTVDNKTNLEIDKNITDENINAISNSDGLAGYKLTNEGDTIVEGILDILPDGYGFLRGENYLSDRKSVV